MAVFQFSALSDGQSLAFNPNAGVLNFEGKFWRTLPMLAWCPGILTRRYIDGQRARFISPIALFLFSVFLLFGTIRYDEIEFVS